MNKKLTGASFGILGDSYSTFEGYIPEGNACYYPRPEAVDDVLQVEQTWWHRLMTRNNMRLLVNDSFSGATICTHVRETQTKIAAFTERAKRSFSGDIQPNYIFVFGGTNDNWLERTVGQPQYSNWTEEDLKRTLPAFCFVLDYLVQKNPQATIVVPVNTGFKPELVDGMLEAAAHYGAVIVCLADIDKKNGHPSALGMGQIADQVEAVLQSK
ncbi:MAG: hypothetical protein IJX37_08200 [Oscillospiraceae bacterium]|nr:hypothetical protein [Oscillospiraceae bacterium]